MIIIIPSRSVELTTDGIKRDGWGQREEKNSSRNARVRRNHVIRILFLAPIFLSCPGRVLAAPGIPLALP
jgi:hypothetical protein